MKEKLMIIIENFLNFFSDWNFFLIKLGKNRVFCIGTGAHNRPLRYTEKIPVRAGCLLGSLWYEIYKKGLQQPLNIRVSLDIV